MKGDQKVPDMAKVRDRKPDLWMGRCQASRSEGWPWALAGAINPVPVLSPGPIPAPTW